MHATREHPTNGLWSVGALMDPAFLRRAVADASDAHLPDDCPQPASSGAHGRLRHRFMAWLRTLRAGSPWMS